MKNRLLTLIFTIVFTVVFVFSIVYLIDIGRWKLSVIIAIVVGAIGTVYGSANKNEEKTENAEQVAPVDSRVKGTSEATSVHGTSEVADCIIRQAKDDANGPDAEAKAETAYRWIVDTVPKWYDSPEIMVQVIYRGALVKYYYTGKNHVREEIGSNTVKSVKYVYCGVETVLDDATLECILKIREGIAKEQC